MAGVLGKDPHVVGAYFTVALAVLAVALSVYYVGAASDRLTELQAENEALTEQASVLSARVSELSAELNGLKQELADARAVVQRYEKDVNYYRRVLTLCRLELKERKAELSALEDVLDEKEAVISGLEAAVAELNSGLVGCRSELSECRDDVRGYRDRLRSCRASLSYYRDMLNNYRRGNSELLDYVAVLEGASPVASSISLEDLQAVDRAVGIIGSQPEINHPDTLVLPVFVSVEETDIKALKEYCSRLVQNLEELNTFISNSTLFSEQEKQERLQKIQEYNKHINTVCSAIDALETSKDALLDVLNREISSGSTLRTELIRLREALQELIKATPN